jgi:phosphoribosylformylglycinamidine synthase
MTEEVYDEPLATFANDMEPGPVITVPVMQHGRQALEDISQELGLGFDDWDLDYYTHMFRDDVKRDPTNVELFDIAQSNSEHSRHWFFKADIHIDGELMPEDLFSLVKAPLEANPRNSVIGFHDNSSALRGGPVTPTLPVVPGAPSALAPQERDWDVLLTAETHNFPCAVAPYPGAETGTGGRIRDTHATGTGSIMGIGTAGYCVGNLQLEGYQQPWEDAAWEYPESLASPQQILTDASNGASDYGNKFGEPVLAGYTRTFGMRLPNGERREWIKPIMFSAGLGQIDHSHLEKLPPALGMVVVKIGGPAYRIGMGGGAASSVPSGGREGGNAADLDFNAVQRGDAEMAQKLWRVVRSCVELGMRNPIQQIHDQGAGGNCNVVKEIIYPLGAKINVRKIKLGDPTMSVLEIWGAEYQENDCLLLKQEDCAAFEAICARERCSMQVLGEIDGSGRITLVDPTAPPEAPTPVDLDLEKVLGKMPNKTFKFQRQQPVHQAFSVPEGTTAADALDRVLRLPSVASKRFLTTKVDRSVGGLVAQQQCVGPLQLPLADVAVMAKSHQGLTGAATSIGEQPYKGLINPAAMARLALGEALTNLVWAAVTALPDIKASVNWMYAAKMGQEGAAMYNAAIALKDAMLELGLACDGGKDSLSMAASAGGETVMAPGNLVVSAYVGCPDITLTVDPALQLPGSGRLIHVDLAAGGARRLGGSCLAQAFQQIGDDSPDVEASTLAAAFNATQALLQRRLISAGHDISDGGIAVALLEMAFAGNTGIQVDLLAAADPLATLFAEELGLLLEVAPEHEAEVLAAYADAGVSATAVGSVAADAGVSIAVGGQQHISGTAPELRDVWEETGFQLERLQAAEATVTEEQTGLAARTAPQWRLPFTPEWTPPEKLAAQDKVRVAVLREEGSNGDREMASAIHAAGMEPWDITMSDLLHGRASLDSFQGIVFVGGFSYADVLESAKGWAGTIRYNSGLWASFQAFYTRPDTWSLGVCNGCQLMALLGWVPGTGGGGPDGPLLPSEQQPRFLHNDSGRFESRWATVEVREGSPAIMLAGMGGSNLGIWCAHGEGRCFFPDSAVRDTVLQGNLAPLRYTNPAGECTEVYPFNPNGSADGIAALCSPDGRHLALMPHPERCYLGWQQPWVPKELGLAPDGPGPWLRLFQNARTWAESHHD